MNRSSSSCLRAGEQDEGQNNSSIEGTTSKRPPPSVTILHKETLPTYSCERFYMLSEIEMNSPPAIFLSSLEEEETTTIDTETDELLSSFPPFLIFYVFWRPTDPQDVNVFVKKTLQSKINRLNQHVEFASFEAVAERMLKTSSSRSATNITTTIEAAVVSSDNRKEVAATEEANTNDNSKPSCCVYIVVDRLPPKDNENVDAAEQLVRTVATDATLRDTIQGITVGVSNHVRAAPGLEACHDAVGLGAKDRRKISNPIATSFLGIVTESADDLLGLQDTNECDAAEGVQQSRVSAEYNGRGNLQSYAMNAHGVWRQRHGLPPPKVSQRRTPRRIRRLPIKSSRETEFLVYDTIAALVLIFYVCFHFGHLLFPNEN